MTDEKAYGMTVMMTTRVKRRMRTVGMMSLMSLLVMGLSSRSSLSPAGAFSLTEGAGVGSELNTWGGVETICQKYFSPPTSLILRLLP